VPLRVPKIFNLCRDPFEMMKSLEAFPPRQKPAAFNLDRVLEELTIGGVSSH
jgi:hypothetical protein